MGPSDLEIRSVKTADERRAFVEFQWTVYKDDKNWVPPLISERLEFVDRERHPFHRHSEVELFMAYRGAQLVGTIAAILNNRHNEFQGERIGFFGLFEVLPDREAAEALLETAADWARQRGLTALRGPANYSTNEEVGLLVDGWDGPPVMMMTYNPRYYVDFIEGAGFHKVMDLLAYMVDLSTFGLHGETLPPKLVRVADKIRERGGFTVRGIDMRRFDEEVARFKVIYNSAWAKNWGFVPLTDDEIDHMAVSLRQLLDPDIVLFAEKDGEPIGAMLPLPDVSQALIKAYPRPGTPEWLTTAKLIWHWKIRHVVDRFRGFAGGVLEPYRGRGVEAVLMVEMARAALPRYRSLEISWVLESNMMMRRTAEMLGGEVYRTYRLYEKAL
ncbi:MAG: N-acetyltransferase [Anaerolineales bacterium]|nr:N-acetyltransferase [Anaerolineales bacterium]